MAETTKTYPVKLPDGATIRVTVPPEDVETQRILEQWPVVRDAVRDLLHSLHYDAIVRNQKTVERLRTAVDRAEGVA